MDKKEENLIEKANKLSLPATILIGCIILGVFYFFVESNKQKSIEKQQQIEQSAKEIQQIKDDARQELLLKQKECEALSVGVMKKWNNVMGVTYDEKIWKDCVVTLPIQKLEKSQHHL